MICALRISRWRDNPPIGKALAADGFKHSFGAHGVIETKFFAMVVTEVKLGSVAV